MNSKAILIPLIAILGIFLITCASAGELSNNVETRFNDIILDSGVNIAAFTGDTVPVKVSFESAIDATDVRIKVWIEGYRSDISASTRRFNIVEDKIYTELLSLELPSDIKDTTKDYTLHVSISNPTDYDHEEYELTMQRESYDFDILSVDYDTKTSAGDIVPVSVVIENIGMEELEDGYVVVSIDELGISARGYFGDLIPTDICDECDTPDSLQKTVYLKIPKDAPDGIYDMTIKIYNKESSTTANKIIKIEEAMSSMVLAAVKNQDIRAGETKAYELLIVNSGENIKVYNIAIVSGANLQVSAPSVVTVGPDSSETVPITVTASQSAEIGAYTFSVDVDGNQVVFGANVISEKVSPSVLALTVVLVIVFVVLLIILLVLLTRKEKPIEEAETSYY